jgi:hypothetical protein
LFDRSLFDNLSCKKFKATSFDFPPRMTNKTMEDGTSKYVAKKPLCCTDLSLRLYRFSSCRYGGYEYLIFEAIASKLMFSFTINPPKICCTWGNEVDEGRNFTGLLGDLYNGYSDVGIANLYDTPLHRKALDVTKPYTVDYGCFMVNCVNGTSNTKTECYYSRSVSRLLCRSGCC